MQYQLMVWENVMYKAKETGEIPEDVPVKETASLFFTTILGHAVLIPQSRRNFAILTV